MEKQEGLKLTEEVAAKYQMEGNHAVGEYHFNGDCVHLQYITLEKADSLVENGFPYMVPAKEKKVKALEPGK